MFVPGRDYSRTTLHEEFGGQQRGGICTPSKHAIVLLFTGESGHRYGYRDGFNDAGYYEYTGEGQVGNMEFKKGNAAIRDHEANGKALHLFEIVKAGRVRYVAETRYLGHHMTLGPDRNGDERKLIVFHLEFMLNQSGTSWSNKSSHAAAREKAYWREPLAKLRRSVLDMTPLKPAAIERKEIVHRRSDMVRVYVLRRAKGTCESCKKPAPFRTLDDRPYLEPHHITRLADGGPDHPRWVAAICPNCHRRIHYGADGSEINEALADRIGEIEAEPFFIQ